MKLPLRHRRRVPELALAAQPEKLAVGERKRARRRPDVDG
jgi:hypothetical protein